MGFDIHYELLRPDEASGGRLVTFRYKAAVGVRGPQKLVNRWLKCLLTAKGSDPLNKAYGTGFPSLIGSNFGRIDELSELITVYVDDCNAQIRALDRLNRPPANEAFASAEVVSVQPMGGDGVAVFVVLRNIEGVLAKLPLPLITGLRT